MVQCMTCMESYVGMVFWWLACYHKLLWSLYDFNVFIDHHIWISMISLFFVWWWTRGLFEKFPTKRAKTRKCAFGKFFHSFWEFRNFKKINIEILLHQKMPLMFLRQLISSVDGKVFENFSKIYLESTKFENQCIKIGCSNYTLTFCNLFWKFKVVEKVINEICGE